VPEEGKGTKVSSSELEEERKDAAYLNNARKVILLSLDWTQRREVGGSVVRRKLRTKRRGRRRRVSDLHCIRRTRYTYAEARTSRPESFSESEGDVTIEKIA